MFKVSVDAKNGADNISTQHTAVWASHTEVHKLSILHHERNLLKRRSGPPSEPYHIPRGKTIHVGHYSKEALEQRIPKGNISMINLLDEKSLDKIEESTGKPLEELWTLGSASADVLAVFIII